MAASTMIITSGGHCSSRESGDEVHCPFPGPHSQPYSYSGYTASCLGKAQTICGVICIILEILGLGVDIRNHRSAPGIWCGLLFVCAGVVSILCGKHNTRDWIKTNLVATFIACVFTMGPLINCSLVSNSFGPQLLCGMLMATTSAELIVALSTIVICTAAIRPQYFHLVGIPMMASASSRPGGRVSDTFQVVYVPPAESDDTSSSTQPGSLHVSHPQTLTVSPGLHPPTCVVIPPTPSPPLGTDEDSPIGEMRSRYDRT